jgi:hypothetical protein
MSDSPTTGKKERFAFLVGGRNDGANMKLLWENLMGVIFFFLRHKFKEKKHARAVASCMRTRDY